MRVKKVYFSRRGTSFILSGTFMVRLDRSISGKKIGYIELSVFAANTYSQFEQKLVLSLFSLPQLIHFIIFSLLFQFSIIKAIRLIIIFSCTSYICITY